MRRGKKDEDGLICMRNGMEESGEKKSIEGRERRLEKNRFGTHLIETRMYSSKSSANDA